MEFGKILQKAQRNEVAKKESIGHYSTKFEPSKKEQRNENQVAINVEKFFEKMEQEKRQKRLESLKKKADLLALRSKDKKAVKRVGAMLKRTKSANQSVIEDAVDSDNTAITLAGPAQPDEDDYGYVSQEASAFYNKMMEKYNKMPAEPPKLLTEKRKVSTNLNDTKDRAKAALEREKEKALMPHKRKRKPENLDDDSGQGSDEKHESKKLKVEKLKPKGPPPMTFGDLMKLAEEKQFEPIKIDKKPRGKLNPPTETQNKELEKVRERDENKNDKNKMPGPDKRKSAYHRNSIVENVEEKINKSSSTSISSDVLTKIMTKVSSSSKTEKLSEKTEIIYKPKNDWGPKHPAAGRMVNSNNSSLTKELERVSEWEERKNDENKMPAPDKRKSADHQNSIGENVKEKINKSSSTSISSDVLTKIKTKVSSSSKTEKLSEKSEIIYKPKNDWGPKHPAAGRMVNSNNSSMTKEMEIVSESEERKNDKNQMPAPERRKSADHRNSIGENVKEKINKSSSTSISSDVLTKIKTKVSSSSKTEKLSEKTEIIYKPKNDWGPKHPAAGRMVNSINSSLTKELERVRESEERKNDKNKMPAPDKRKSADHRNSIGENVKEKINKSSSTSISSDVLTEIKTKVSSSSKTEKLSEKTEIIYKPKNDWGPKHPAAGRMVNSINSSLTKELERVRESEERKNDNNKMPAPDKRKSADHRNSIGENVKEKINKSSSTSISSDVLTKIKTKVSSSSKTGKLSEKTEIIYKPKNDWGPKHPAAGRIVNSINSSLTKELERVRESEKRKNDKNKMPPHDKRKSANHQNPIGENVKEKINKSSSTSISSDVLTKIKTKVSSSSKTEKLSEKTGIIYKPKNDWGPKHPAAGRMVDSNNSSLTKELERVRESEERKNDKNKMPPHDKRKSADHRNSIGENVKEKMNKSSSTSISSDVLSKIKTKVSSSSKTEKLSVQTEVIYKTKFDYGPKHPAYGRMINSNNSSLIKKNSKLSHEPSSSKPESIEGSLNDSKKPATGDMRKPFSNTVAKPKPNDNLRPKASLSKDRLKVSHAKNYRQRENAIVYQERQSPLDRMKSKEFPPTDMMRPKKFPPADMRKPMSRPNKMKVIRGRIMDDDDEEEDSEMDDFIDDGPEEEEDYSKHIKEIFGYDKSKYANFDDEDDLQMVSSFAQQMKEEVISKKIGMMEDLEDMKLEEDHKRRKALIKKKLSKKR